MPVGRHPRMRLTHLTLRNWRNFKQADFDLQDRLFIGGPNASGKSNLLDALRFLRQIASAGGGFQDAVASRGGISGVRCLAARNFNQGRVTLSISFGDDHTPEEWTYGITFSAERRGRHRPILTNEIVTKRGRKVVERPTLEDGDDPEGMTQTYLEQVNKNKQFRQIVEFLGSIRYLHPVPQFIREPDRCGDRHDDPYGSDLLLRIARTPERTRIRRLRRIGEALKTAVPQLDQLELVPDEIGHWHLEARYKHWRPQLARHDERLFSDGTLRLIGLFWTLLDGKRGSGPALVEDPELSLHTSVVRQLPTVFSRTRAAGGPQVVLSTHSNEILDDPGIGADEAVVLKPGDEGTEALSAEAIPDVRHLLDAGMSLAEIVRPWTEPENVPELPVQIARA